MWSIRSLLAACLMAACCLGVIGCFQVDPPRKKLPRRVVIPIRPIVPIHPAPRRPRPCPGPWCPRESLTAVLTPTVAGRISPDGVPIECDYPAERMQANLAGADGAGLCVFAAASWAMDWHGIDNGRDLLPWMQRKQGGGWPEKFDAVMKEYFREKNQPVPGYTQMTGSDTTFVLKALATGKIVCATYNHSPTGRYNGRRIAHMVCIHHCDGERVAIGDNNYIGSDNYEWLPMEQWQSCFLGDNGKGWAIAFDAPPPPPVPHN